MYIIIKYAHMTIISLTFIFFIINFVLTIKGSDKVNNKLLKIGPHILYTLFILSFIYLLSFNPQWYPFFNGWGSSKLAGFVFYVLSITLALKWAKTTLWRIVGLISAVFWLAMTVKLGFSDVVKAKAYSNETGSFIELGQTLSTIIS